MKRIISYTITDVFDTKWFNAEMAYPNLITGDIYFYILNIIYYNYINSIEGRLHA